jgi:PAS domain S-box-containing protein
MWQLVSPEHHPMLRGRLRRRIAGETMESSFEFEIRHRDGHRIWVELTTSGVTDARGKLKAIQGVARDISDRKQAEDKFLREQARFKLIFETIPIGIAFHTVHPNGSVTRMINDAHLHICGLSRADHDLPDIYRQITHPEDYALQQQWNEQIRAGHIKQFAMEKRYLRRDGQLVWVIFSYQRETYPDGTIEELTTVMDITERKLQEEQLRKLSRAVECSPASIIITNPAGDIDYVNPKFTAVTGYTLDEVRGKNPRLLKGSETSPAEYEQLWQAITAGREWRGVFHNRRKNGEMFWESASISPVTDKAGRITHFLAVKEDISKDRLLEEQFRQMQKMEAIGRLAGGVAHDFNNILAIILMQAELMAAEAALSPDLREFATEISKAAQRGANLTRQLLLFSRRQVMQTCDLDLNEVVNNLMKMLQRILGEDIRIHFKVSPRPLSLRADAGMLDQVLMNLSVNARDAMPRGGELTIQTSAEQFDELTASQFPQARPGAFGCLTVSDTGHGIAPEILPLIFDPFFTTKEAGKGTGLGLATVFSIVQQHHGWIDVYSQVEHGTTFRIFFPLQTAAQTSGLASPRKTPLPRGTETILLVEDESSLRTLLANILAQLGYRVLDAADSSVALDLWARHADKIDLLLTDLMLPDGMNGRELADQLLAARPNLKVLYASGYSAEVAGKDLPLQEGVNFLAKPFHAHRLAQAVRSRLDARDTAPRKSGPTAQLASS